MVESHFPVHVNQSWRIYSSDMIFSFAANSSSSTNESTVTDNCTLQTLAASAVTPYFFPFVLEYSLIAMSVMVGIYQTLSVRVEVCKIYYFFHTKIIISFSKSPDSNISWSNVGPTSWQPYRSWTNVEPTCVAVWANSGTNPQLSTVLKCYVSGSIILKDTLSVILSRTDITLSCTQSMRLYV